MLRGNRLPAPEKLGVELDPRYPLQSTLRAILGRIPMDWRPIINGPSRLTDGDWARLHTGEILRVGSSNSPSQWVRLYKESNLGLVPMGDWMKTNIPFSNLPLLAVKRIGDHFFHLGSASVLGTCDPEKATVANSSGERVLISSLKFKTLVVLGVEENSKTGLPSHG